MKKILIILTAVISNFNIGSAQEIVKLVPISEQDWEYIYDNDENIYLKDEDYLLDKFEGKWAGILNGRQYELRIEKLIEPKTVLGYKRDYLRMNYVIKDNDNNVIESTLVLDKNNPIVPSGMGLSTLDVYRFTYLGFLSKCGQEGQLIAKVKNPNEMNLFFHPSHIMLNIAECPDGRAKQVFPVNEGIVLRRQ